MTTFVRIFLLCLSCLGPFSSVNCDFLSNGLTRSICEQHRKFGESGDLQQSEKSAPENETCGWYKLRKDAECSSSVASFMECKTVEERQSPEFYTKMQDNFNELQVESGGDGRIVGGEEAERHEYPSILRLIIKGKGNCAANLLSPQWVLTAAHCKLVSEPSMYELIAGDHNRNETDEENPARQRRTAVLYEIHEDYNTTTQENDIGLIKVDPPFQLNDQVKASILPDPKFRVDGVIRAVGWGVNRTDELVSATILRKVDLDFMDDVTCRTRVENTVRILADSMMCAGDEKGEKGFCFGDSGGPLYVDGEQQLLVGLVSWGVGCANSFRPGVATEVAYFVEWIKKQTCL